MSMTDATHLGDRMALTPAQAQAQRQEAHRGPSLAALVLSGHIANGDEGAIRRYLHELRHLSQDQVNPWHVLEHLALRLTADEPDDPEPAEAEPAQQQTAA